MSNNETTIQLSKRELQVLEMVATGASNQQIARQLVISINTVKTHVRNIHEKLGVQSRTEATLRAIQEGWIVVDNKLAAPEGNEVLTKTYLFTTGAQPPLVRWQQFYLWLAILLALGVMILPLIPQSLPKTGDTYLPPPIGAQAPTPAPLNKNSSSWVSRGPMPTQRAGLGLAAFEGRIFAIGGLKVYNQATRLVEIYDPTTGSWTEGENKPTATTYVSGVVLDDKIYAPGGCTSENQAKDSLEIYDPQTDSWKQGESLPEPRCGYGLVAFEDKIYLFGGWNGESFEDTVFVFSPKENKWAVMDSPMPQAKGYLGAAVLNETIYVVGGYDGKIEFNQTYVFRPQTGEWLEKSPMQEKRGGLKLISVANNLYAIGGGSQAVISNEKYNPDTDAWTTLDTPFNHQWSNMGLTAIDTKIYAMGGWNGTEGKLMDAVVSHQFLFQIFLPFSSK